MTLKKKAMIIMHIFKTFNDNIVIPSLFLISFTRKKLFFPSSKKCIVIFAILKKNRYKMPKTIPIIIEKMIPIGD